MELDTALQNSYSSHILSGKSLPFPCDGLYSLKAAITSTNIFSFPLTRGFTRLKTVYVTFWDGTGKWITNFYHPRNAGVNTANLDNMEWTETLGADRYPVFACESAQESFYRLRLCEQAHGSSGPSFTPHQYYSGGKFVIGQNLELAPGSAHTGLNTRSGSQMTLQFKNITGAVTIHVVLKYEVVVNVSAAGTQLLD